MKEDDLIKKKSVTKGWYLSYILILLVPLCTIFINYIYNIRTVKKEIVKVNEAILNNICENVDAFLEQEINLYYHIYTDENFDSLVRAAQTDGHFYNSVIAHNKSVNEYVGKKTKVGYWIYLDNKDFVIFNGNTGRTADIYIRNRTMGFPLPSYVEWKSMLGRDYDNEYFFDEILSCDQYEKMLIFADSFFYYGNNLVNVFVTFPVKEIAKLTAGMDEDSVFVICITNEGKKVEYCAVGANGVVVNNEQGIETEKYITLSAASDRSNVNYYLLVPKESYWKAANGIRNIHLFSISITLIIGIILISLLVKKNYRPVSKIVDLIEEDGLEGNEFQKIGFAYSEAKQRNNIMKIRLAQHVKNVRSNYLLSFMRGRSLRDKTLEQEIELELDRKNYRMALIGVYVPMEESEKEYDELAFFVVDNVFSELIEDYYYIEDGRYLLYLCFVHEGEEQAWKTSTLEKMNYLCNFVEEKFHISLLVGVSTIETDLNRSVYLYRSLMETFEYKRVIGGNGVITTEEMTESDVNSSLYVYQRAIIEAVEKGNLINAKSISEQLFYSVVNVPYALTKLRILETFQLINDCCNKMVVDPVKRLKIVEWMDSLISAKEIEELKTAYFQMLEFICNIISGQWKVDGESIVDVVRKIVEDNYADNSLNVDAIAVKMEKNPRYITRVFKEKTGEGVLDYLNAYRIRKSQELLLSKKISMEEVAMMTGYGSSKSFRRNFQKIVGMTPSAYLESKE